MHASAQDFDQWARRIFALVAPNTFLKLSGRYCLWCSRSAQAMLGAQAVKTKNKNQQAIKSLKPKSIIINTYNGDQLRRKLAAVPTGGCFIPGLLMPSWYNSQQTKGFNLTAVVKAIQLSKVN